eukprot:scaffold1.g5437.t1
MRLARLPPPDLVHPSSVRIRVSAAALNFADALQVQGQYQEKPQLPFVPGNECSGVVTEVCALTQGGAFAEEVVVREGMAIRLPQGESMDLQAAAGARLPVAFGTAWLALHDRADLQPGQALLVLGAAGGVGLAAAMGARVVAVARGARKAGVLREAGADAVIDVEHLRPEELRGLVRQAAPEGVDVVFDPVGGPLLTEALKTLAWGARILTIGFAAGIPKLPLNVLLVKNATVHGVYWGSYAQHEPRAFRRSLDEVVKLLAAGRIRVHVSHIYSLEQARVAAAVVVVINIRGGGGGALNVECGTPRLAALPEVEAWLVTQVVGKLLLMPGPLSMPEPHARL